MIDQSHETSTPGFVPAVLEVAVTAAVLVTVASWAVTKLPTWSVIVAAVATCSLAVAAIRARRMRYVLGDQGRVIGKVVNPFPRHWPESKVDEALPGVWTSIRAEFPGAVALLTLREVLKSRAFRRQIL